MQQNKYQNVYTHSSNYVPHFVAATFFNGLTADSECTLETKILNPKSHAHT